MRLLDVGIPWCVVGGWAIDLFLGTRTRAHDDLEIAITRADFPALRDHVAPLRFYVVGDGEVRALATGASPPSDKHQNWLLEGSSWRMDVMLEPGDARDWVFRRDRALCSPRQHMIGVTSSGIPYLRPQGVLLYKAKAQRPKDDADFAAVLPQLEDEARAWLGDALQRLHPGHAWIAELGVAGRRPS
jgi:hypothetical protein